VSRALGISEEQLRDLARYQTSAAFSPLERRVLDLAVAMAKTPADIPPALVDELRHDLDPAQLVELAAAIAWENYRARFNRVFGIRPAGFVAEGAFCVLPERDPGVAHDHAVPG
jgi:alkylhydroperoxidase family enzyme